MTRSRPPLVDSIAIPVESASSARDDLRVIQALEDYMAALERGLRPDRREVLRDYADVASRLEPCLDGVDLVHRPHHQTADRREDSTTLHRGNPGPSTPIGIPECDLSEFEIVRELGRGGMGVVYEAEQLANHRRVALKVMPYAASLDRRQRLRFRTEVLAAARLDHPNIVPVIGAGSERGVPFYVMRLIEGETLAGLIHRLRLSHDQPPDPDAAPAPSGESPAFESLRAKRVPRSLSLHRAVARLGYQAARALEHAHQHGVLHRDIKPANLLVDTGGRLYVTDFGLARTPEDLNLTVSGALLGTIRYMSPEQALGHRDHVDHRSDLYSLGATLYELLTLRPAFDGEVATELLRSIAEVDPVPPRTLDPRIPRSLETIILKALSKDPAKRYASARAFAEDLERYLQGRPILARRSSVLKKGRRWASGHRALLAAGVASLAVLAVTSWQRVGSTTSEPGSRIETSREALNGPETRSLRNLELAFEAAERLLTQLDIDRVAGLESMELGSTGLLFHARDLYQRLAEANRGEPTAASLVAAAYTRAGEIGAVLNQVDDARHSYESATLQIEGLVKREPDVLQHRLDLATVLSRLGQLLHQAGRVDDARGFLSRSVTILEDLAHRCPDNDPLRRNVATRQAELGVLLVALQRGTMSELSFQPFTEVRLLSSPGSAEDAGLILYGPPCSS